jgi:hypothetical protein
MLSAIFALFVILKLIYRPSNNLVSPLIHFEKISLRITDDYQNLKVIQIMINILYYYYPISSIKYVDIDLMVQARPHLPNILLS